MTNMRRITMAVPNDVDEAIIKLKKSDRFARCSYSEVARYLMKLGIAKNEIESKPCLQHHERAG